MTVEIYENRTLMGEAEAERYGKLLKENPTDIVIMGIGENGHITSMIRP